MPVSQKIQSFIKNASWIRRMFEEGTVLKARYGEDQVCDFSLGNPTLEPPPSFKQALREAVEHAPEGSHRYMPNLGYPEVRRKVALSLSRSHQREVTEHEVVMTVGAAGALNCVLKAVLDPGDEVVVWAPFFPEYMFYVDNHGGRLVVAETNDQFDVDPQALRRVISPRTRAVIINSPNNPTGRVYGAPLLAQLGEVLAEAEAQFGRPIYLVSDEPYRKISYLPSLPSVFEVHPNTVMCTSHSKDLGLPGERIGYAVINPACPGKADLLGALAFTNRILGYVNAPALMQRLVADLQEETLDPGIYRAKRDLFLAGLRGAGYEVVEPEGAFYLFPRSPIPDDTAFVRLLAQNLVLAVPGQGFGRAGYFRLAYCVDDATIERALPALAEARSRALAS